MQRLKGIVVSDGLARGEAFVAGTGDMPVQERRIPRGETDRELARLEKALREARKDLLDLKDRTRALLGEVGEIFSTHLAILGDEAGLLQPIRRLIQQERWDAVTAVSRHFDSVAEELRKLPEPLPSRVPDLLDIRRKLLAHLAGRKGPGSLDRLPRKVVVVADDLSPSQTATLDREKVLAFATDRGGPASHTAILARGLGIPALVGMGNLVRAVRPGDQVLIDGINGEVIVNPDEETVREFEARRRRLHARGRSATVDHGPLRTADGHPVEILGNIDSGGGVKDLKELGVRGIGLFRTEYLYLGRDDAPDEDLQAEHYARLVRDMAPYPVCIRTMDFGADKWDHRVGAGNEPNPFLGMRAIRLSFAHEGVFRAQLRAILRASAAGNVRLMFPMITDAAEFRRARAVLRSEIERLRHEGVAFNPDIAVGAMVETPAAALTAASILKEADFLSLGSNDLTQYTLAVDRTNPLVAALFASHHPAVLQLIKAASDAARAAGKKLSACGEMAGSLRYSPVLLGLGITTLSMAGSRVGEVADQIRRLNLEACRETASRMLDAEDARAAGQILDAFLEDVPRRSSRR